MAFKMKGSPMKRNFGIGASPTKQMKPGDLTDEQKADKDAKFMKDREKRMNEPFTGDRSKGGLKTESMEERAKRSEERNDKSSREEFFNRIRKSNEKMKKSPAKDYSMSKGSHDHPHSPAKQKNEREVTTTIKEGEQFKNEKGQSQEDVMNKRKKNVDEAKKKTETYDENVTKHSEKHGGLTKSEHESYTENMKKLNKNLQDMQNMYIHSSDSISNVNRQYDINRKKASDDSGLFAKSPYKQFEEGDYYDTRSKKRKKN